MKFIVNIIFLLIVICLIGYGFAYSGIYDVSASVPHSEFMKEMFKFTMKRSVKRHSKDIVVPDLSEQDKIEKGFALYKDMCAGCHGSPGVEGAEGFNPSPPDLADKAREWSAAELFSITKNGIKMSGMPSFGHDHSDDEIWDIVAFLKKLPEITPEDYMQMTRQAEKMPNVHNNGDHSH